MTDEEARSLEGGPCSTDRRTCCRSFSGPSAKAAVALHQVTCPKEKEIPGLWGITRGWLWINANSWDISMAEEQTYWLNNGYLS